VNDLDEELRSQRVVVLTSVQLCKATRNRRKLRTALIDVDKYFPDDPLYSLRCLRGSPQRRWCSAMPRMH
jgi:hypothetical protein